MATLQTVGPFQDALEVRPLPSTDITQLRRYYEPVRHPTRPGLSLAGVRLGHAPTAWGFPCCVRSPCADMPSPLPRWDRRRDRVVPLKLRLRPSPSLCWVGSHIPRFEACSAFTHVTACLLAESPKATLSIEGFDRFVASPAAPIATGWNDNCRVGIAPTEDRRLFTAHNVSFSPFQGQAADNGMRQRILSETHGSLRMTGTFLS